MICGIMDIFFSKLKVILSLKTVSLRWVEKCKPILK